MDKAKTGAVVALVALIAAVTGYMVGAGYAVRTGYAPGVVIPDAEDARELARCRANIAALTRAATQ